MGNINKEAEQGSKTSSHGSAKHAAPRRRNGLTVFVAAIILIVAIILIFTVYVSGYDNVYPNTYIGDIKISGMNESEVMNVVAPVYSADKLKDKVLPLNCKTRKVELPLNDLEINFDNVALVQNAINSGKEGGVLQRTVAYVARMFSPTVIQPVITYKKDVLSAAFDNVTDGFETEPVGHTFKIEPNSVTIHGTVNGVKADRAAATAQAEEQMCSMKIDGIDLNPTSVVPEELDFDEFYKWLTSDAQDAYYEKIDGKVVVHDSKPKCEVERKTVEDALDALKTSSDNMVKISVVTTEPENTTEKLKENLYKDQLGSYSTNYGASSAARANNVRLATSRINGIELMPGEELSYDRTIMPRTASNGYMAAPVYVGNKVESGMGGGICQPSSTLYAAALYANLEIVERHNHSLTVSYLPPGLDATIAEGSLDLRIRNNTDYPVKISSSADGGVVSFRIFGYNPKNISVDIERSSGGGSYYVTRVVKENGAVLRREKMTSSTYGTPEKDDKKPETEKKNEQSEAGVPAMSPADEQSGAEQPPSAAQPTASPAESAAEAVPQASGSTAAGQGAGSAVQAAADTSEAAAE